METLRNIFYSSENRNQDNSSSFESTYENLSDINFNLNTEKKPLKINKKRKNRIRDKIKNKKSQLGKQKKVKIKNN
jgi:DNA topoisomerase VI subunit A